MFLSKKNPNRETICTTIAELAGDEVTLTRVSESEFATTHLAMLAPLLYTTAGFKDAPSEDRLRDLLIEREHLILWHTMRRGESVSSGYCGWSYFSGPAFLFFMPADDAPLDLIVISEALEMVGVAYFKFTEGQQLFMYIDKPIEEDIHETLVECGFDPIDELPTIDNETEGAYVLKRATFEAYYGGGEGEDDFEP
jgi:hypothetical protein